MPSKLKLLIQQTLHTEYKLPRVGITFTGWKSCQQDPNADAILIVVNSKDQPLGRASVGMSETYGGESHLLPKGKKTFVLINLREAFESLLNDEAEVAYSALHEFSHLAGLRHENIHEQAYNDPNCTEDDLGSEIAQDGVHYLTSYDPSSITNYCLYSFLRKSGLEFKTDQNGNVTNSADEIIFPFKNLAVYTDKLILKKNDIYPNIYKARIGLSENDIKGLRCLYLKENCQN